jgi:hypothetical protein
MITKVAEFKTLAGYQNWLSKYGSSVTIINVSTTKRWGLLLGFFGSAKSYTVTYQTSSGASTVDQTLKRQ